MNSVEARDQIGMGTGVQNITAVQLFGADFCYTWDQNHVCLKRDLTFLFFLSLFKDLLAHVEKGMGKNLAFRCSNAINVSVQSSQQYMIGK